MEREAVRVKSSRDVPLPRWVYRPGRDAAPDRVTLDRIKESVPARFDAFVPADTPALVYALALNDAGFFWECHEVLEAIWKVAPQGGRDRILLRACIQIANANLKSAMDQPRAAARLLAEAIAELEELKRRGPAGDGFAAAFAADQLEAAARRAFQEPTTLPTLLNYSDNMQQSAGI